MRHDRGGIARGRGAHGTVHVAASGPSPPNASRSTGIAVSPETFERAFNVVHETAEKLDLDCHPTYFETVTAMAFWLFREQRVETAVVEVGLGGRLDSTNVLQPVLTVITPIDFDHEIYLGHTLEAIAGEKAGILKPGVPAVFARQRPEAMAVLEARAAELGCSVMRAEGTEVRELHMDARGSSFLLGASAERIVCPLAGQHQVDNAVAAALALRALGISTAGMADARWPGRLEFVAPNPDTLLDGAHNPAGARALASYLTRFYGDRRIWMIFGAMRDKALDEVAEVLFPLAHELVFTAPDSSRALRPDALVELAGKGRTETDIASALAFAQARAQADNVIVITGSLFLIGEARRLFLRPVPKLY